MKRQTDGTGTRWIVLILSTLGISTFQPALAHHSFAATYFVDQTVTIEGDVVQFVYRNPHSILQLIAKDQKGKATHWAVEWAGTLDLDRSGVKKERLLPGDHVIVTGSPARNPDDRRIRLKTIERPSDGWKWTRPYD